MTFKYGRIFDGNDIADIISSGFTSGVSVTLGGKYTTSKTRKEILEYFCKYYESIEIGKERKLLKYNNNIYLVYEDKIRIASIEDMFKYKEETNELYDLPVLG